MKKLNYIFLSFILMMFLAKASLVQAIPTSQIYQDTKNSIVLLIAYDKYNLPLSLGSGFFIDEHHIATNYHVVDGASKVVFKKIGSDKTEDVKTITNYSKKLDVAILEVSESHKPLIVRKDAISQIGEKVITIGNPKGLTGSVSEGIISGIRKYNEFVFLQITAPISPGSSGGPLFNEQGEVIGITTMTLKDSQNINFAIASHLIFDLKEQGKNWEPSVPNKVFDSEKGSAGIEIIEPRVSSILGGELTWSISNKSGQKVKNIAYFLIFRNVVTGEMLHYEAFNDSTELLSGLSKRYAKRISALKNYQVVGESIYPFSENNMYGRVSVELRVLSYDIVESKVGVDVLDLIN